LKLFKESDTIISLFVSLFLGEKLNPSVLLGFLKRTSDFKFLGHFGKIYGNYKLIPYPIVLIRKP